MKKIITDVANAIESIHQLNGISIKCVAIFLSGEIKTVGKSIRNQIIYKKIVGNDYKSVPTASLKSKGTAPKKHLILHRKCQEFLKLWPENCLQKKRSYIISDGQEPYLQHYFCPKSRSKKLTKSQDIAVWLCENLDIHRILKLHRKAFGIGQKRIIGVTLPGGQRFVGEKYKPKKLDNWQSWKRSYPEGAVRNKDITG